MGRHHRVTIRLQQYCNGLSLLSFNKVCSRINYRPSWSSRPSAGGLSVLLVPKNRMYPLCTRPFGVELCEKKYFAKLYSKRVVRKKCRSSKGEGGENQNFAANLLIVLAETTSTQTTSGSHHPNPSIIFIPYIQDNAGIQIQRVG